MNCKHCEDPATKRLRFSWLATDVDGRSFRIYVVNKPLCDKHAHYLSSQLILRGLTIAQIADLTKEFAKKGYIIQYQSWIWDYVTMDYDPAVDGLEGISQALTKCYDVSCHLPAIGKMIYTIKVRWHGDRENTIYLETAPGCFIHAKTGCNAEDLRIALENVVHLGGTPQVDDMIKTIEKLDWVPPDGSKIRDMNDIKAEQATYHRRASKAFLN